MKKTEENIIIRYKPKSAEEKAVLLQLKMTQDVASIIPLLFTP